MKIICKSYLALKLTIIQKLADIEGYVTNISITYDKKSKKWIAEFKIK